MRLATKLNLLKRRSKRLVFFISTLIISISTIAVTPEHTSSLNEQLPEWKLTKKSTDFKLYTRSIDGSKFLQTKAEVKFNVPLDKVKVHFTDQGCWQWNQRCSESQFKISKDKNIGEYLYVGIDMPWPVDDRDFTFKVSKFSGIKPSSNLPTYTLLLEPISGIKKSKRYVRGQSRASYYLESISESSNTNTKQTLNSELNQARVNYLTKLTIVMHTEFGGSVSPSLINGKLVDELENDVIALLELTR